MMEINPNEIADYSEVFVVFSFKDGTKQTIHTSFNEEVLEQYGARSVQEKLFDLDRLKFVPFRRDALNVNVYQQKPVFDLEVLQFASRFI